MLVGTLDFSWRHVVIMPTVYNIINAIDFAQAPHLG